MEEITRLSAALAERMRELRADPTDPRLAPLFAQYQALLRQHMATTVPTPAKAAAYDFDLPAEIDALLRGYLDSCPAQAFAPVPALNETEAGRGILTLPPVERVRMVVAAYRAWSSERWGGPQGSGLRRVVSDLLRAKLPLADADAIALVESAAREGFTYASHSPNQAVLGALERHVAGQGLSGELRRAIEKLLSEMARQGAEHNAQGRKLKSGVEALLAYQEKADAAANTVALFKPKQDDWGAALMAKLATLPAQVQAPLGALLTLASEGGKNAKPAKGWLKSAAQTLDRPDHAQLGEYLLDFIECHEPGTPITLENQETLRALLWLAAMAAPEASARRLEAFAQTCLTFSAAHFAYLSLVLGNASIHAFALMPGTAGVGSLTRLRRKLKRSGEIKTVDKALAALAQARGMGAGELEEIGLPDYGFASDGRLEIAVGPATATLTITDANTLETSWRAVDGSPLKGPPAEVKTHHAEALKELKARTKEIGETLKAQCARLERLYLDERKWPLDQWRARYLDEALVAGMTRRLIWSFKLGDRWLTGLPEAKQIGDERGQRVDLDGSDVHVRLWHPMQSEASHVLAWRQRLASLEITQPFKQAHREIYVLTDAERETSTYSNRFAGHIVQQHLFRALCQARGWSAPAFGVWDPGNSRPMKRVPAQELRAEFWVEPIEEESSTDQGFKFLYLSTDQVRFATSAGEPLVLEQVPAVLFSELMRDVDLFVSVANIGNDPTLGLRNAGAHDEYWTRSAFGELTETAKTRQAVLRDLLPGLTIADRCRLDERFLVVTGKLRTYRIHLGSSNIMMAPNDQYLCIVQDHQNAGGRVRLPFEGDHTLSLILSKAFLLADDDKIKDASIVSQIKRV
jgi:Domain of unknown function (DUF4132)